MGASHTIFRLVTHFDHGPNREKFAARHFGLHTLNSHDDRRLPQRPEFHLEKRFDLAPTERSEARTAGFDLGVTGRA